jgi:hypothetical protein
MWTVPVWPLEVILLHNVQEISWLAEWLLASKEWLIHEIGQYINLSSFQLAEITRISNAV